MPSILFLCTGNSCRSQMALGFMRSLHPDWHSESAGLEAHGLNPRAVKVMSELGMDISGQPSRSIPGIREQQGGELPAFDYVVTVCGHAHETCPHWPAAGRIIHQGFDDPPSLASGMDDEEQILAIYRRVRDEIRDWISQLPVTLSDSAN
ncbi:arsenate reductase ArsC [bacterium]|nr:arsenate reductase ArsC [bacterium]